MNDVKTKNEKLLKDYKYLINRIGYATLLNLPEYDKQRLINANTLESEVEELRRIDILLKSERIY